MANTTIPTMPTAPNRSMDSATFTTTADTWVAALGPVTDAMNTLGVEIEADKDAAESSATIATTQATNAASSAAAANNSALAAAASNNATVWVSGTTYAFGVNVISPINAQTYRRIVAGAGTTDPSLDTTNWRVVSVGLNLVVSVSDNYTITAGTANYIATTMTTIGKSVKLPSATAMAVGGPSIIIDNTKGSYPVGIRNSSDVLIMAVAAGSEAIVSLKDNSTTAGIWSVVGNNLEPGLVTMNTRLSSFVGSSAMPRPFVALDDNTSIHFALWSGVSFYAFVVDNTGKVISTPILVTASGGQPVAAFKISATQAIVFFGSSNTNHSAAVLTLTGSSPNYSISVGTVANTTVSLSSLAGASGCWGGEDFQSDPRIAQLSSSLYVVAATNSINNDGYALAVSVSGTTVTIGALSSTISTLNNSQTIYPLTSTTALVICKTGSSAPFTMKAAVLSISGTTTTVNTVNTTLLTSSVNTAPSSVLLSPTMAVIMDDGNVSGTSARAVTLSISGNSVTSSAGVSVLFTASSGMSVAYGSDLTSRYNPRLWKIGATTAGVWVKAAGISRTAVLTVSAETVTPGVIYYKGVSTTSSGGGDGQMLPQGTSEFLSVQQTSPNGEGGFYRVTPSKISGTTITRGFGEILVVPAQISTIVGAVLMAKLSNGNYGILATGNQGGDSGTSGITSISIVKSNGDVVINRGSISFPEMWFRGGNAILLPNVSSSRFVLVGAGFGNPSAGNVDTLQVVNIEVAA